MRGLPLKCGFCAYRFSGWNDLRYHVSQEHREVSIPSEEKEREEFEANTVTAVTKARAGNPWNEHGYSAWGNPT